ncbi:hypothetical protein ACFYM3_21210 [Streptomyces massasporeus]|uniref:Uncharacterized protein n=1 Tax=Streptomyces massasporeus TaxID=67324 RepID=A0ABW6LGW8_9ACTN
MVATVLEAAQHAADLVEVSYDVEQPSTLPASEVAAGSPYGGRRQRSVTT